MAKKIKCDCPPPAPAWLTTFSDLMSLLMTFFVMLVAFATFEEAKIKEALVSLKGAFGILRPGEHAISQPQPPVEQPPDRPPKQGKEDEQLRKRVAKIQAQLIRSGLDRTIGSKVTKDGIVLVALSPVLFDPGSAEIKPEAYEALSLISDIVGEYENEVRIEGHTSDATLEADSPYKSTWELSGARALAVLNYLVEKHSVDPDKLSFMGFGHYRPKKSGLAKGGMEARSVNDRIEIKLLTESEPEDISSHLITEHRDIPHDTETLIEDKQSPREVNPRGP
ncbi:MAG: flagellar motor protein MotB [Candidatus Omnitrophica bacterium]|nr:flagellar motor protein MotB [Candidatus Omnitrophota bacterium]MCA9426772.1 flagellar motor protein MotB [Candidatus Omnitrophota bacterium]MCA9438243.1 flagellar motor protein MotB [Candidatus Omnitrophota bacterium]MCB9770329.1 flagellar motor protein MotB [Candidatus Omnitrophota bacterium]MCB9784516.1 flagellar motor protein MotB [Candidatus Omnitrophota bacterium]